MDAARGPGDAVNAVLNVRGVTHSGQLSVGRGWLEFKAESGSSLRLLLPSVSKTTLDGERLYIMTAACKFFSFAFQSAVLSRRIDEAVARESMAPVAPPSLVNRTGWDVYDHAAEYKRVFGHLLGTRQSAYRLCTLNAQYELCATYPYLFVVPGKRATHSSLLSVTDSFPEQPR